MTTPIRALINALDADDGRDFSPLIGACGSDGFRKTLVFAASGSLDSAQIFQEVHVPDGDVFIEGPWDDERRWSVCLGHGDEEYTAEHPTNPARAWIVATLKAMEARG